MLPFGKRNASLVIGRGGGDGVDGSTGRLQCILDYILEHAQGEERPFLRLNILGIEILGLLDSGASRTFLGGKGWQSLQSLGIPLDRTVVKNCTIANGQICQSIGACELPMSLKGKVRLIQVLVVPSLATPLLLGVDFWKRMGVVPDLRRDGWFFSSESDSPAHVDVVEQGEEDSILTPTERECLRRTVDRNFALMGDGLGCTDLTAHRIVTVSAPIKQRYYPVSPVLQEHINRELDEMLEKGVVEKSNSGWSSPILLVKKKDQGFRVCVDFRKLNAVTERDSYPLPYITNILDKLKDAIYISTLDIKSAYWQVPVDVESRPYTAFTVPGRGLYQFCRMPFGLHNAPATWQRLIDTVLGPELEPNVFVYLDDVVIVTQTFERHIEILEEVFRRLRDANLTVSTKKCRFCLPQMEYLGYVVDRNGLRMNPEKVRAMLDLPVPKNAREVRRVIGMFSWYRRFIPNFSTIVSPITALVRKNRKFCWSDECDSAFKEIKEHLVSDPILSCPDYSRTFEIHTDASGFGIGAVLCQPHDDGEKVVAFLSRSLTKQERNYSTTERECLAVLWAIEKLRPYVEGIRFTVVTDHASLVWLQTLKDPTGRLARWAVRLQQYDFEIKHRKGKEHLVPDALSRSVPSVDAIDMQKGTGDRWYGRMCTEVEKKPIQYSNWRVVDGQLYKYVEPPFKGLVSDADCWKVVLPKVARRAVMFDAHDSPLSGHM